MIYIHSIILNLGKPNPDMKNREEKRKLVNNRETITSWSTEILLSRHAEKVGKGWAWQHNGVHLCF